MREDRYRAMKYLLIGVCGSLLVLWIIGAMFVAKDPNIELIRTARQAIQMADDARRDAEMARKTSSALRIIALVFGVSAPLLLAYVIYRMQSKREAGIEEILGMLEKEKLMNLPEHAMKRIPRKRRHYLRSPSKGKEGQLDKN